MSLDYSFTDIKDYKSVTIKSIREGITQEQIEEEVNMGNHYYYRTDDNGKREYYGYLNPITNLLIWASLMTGFAVITEENYLEVWMRMGFEDFVTGSGRVCETERDSGTRTYRSVTREEVYQHIGLRTNVTKVTPTKFYNNMKARVKDSYAVDGRVH